jgi:D-serine dehydratase
LHHGAWGLTVATPHQLQMARRFGYSRLLLANQLVGQSAIDSVIDELERDPQFDFYCLIDSPDNLEQLARAARARRLSRPLQVLVELGIKGGRTGCRSIESALALARAAAQSPDVVALRGIEGFEGLIHRANDAETLAEVDAFLDRVVECAQRCAQEGLFARGEVLLSAGGSAFYDRVSSKLAHVNLDRPTVVVLRGGCYLIHDHVMFGRAFEQIIARSPVAAGMPPGLKPALEVWSYVQSLPEPGRAIVMLGKRDISYDDMPIPLKWYRPGSEMSDATTVDGDYGVSHLNDQHCYVNVPDDCAWRVGDMVGFGISHPCLTFDKWRVLYLVDDAYRVVDAVRTYF